MRMILSNPPATWFVYNCNSAGRRAPTHEGRAQVLTYARVKGWRSNVVANRWVPPGGLPAVSAPEGSGRTALGESKREKRCCGTYCSDEARYFYL